MLNCTETRIYVGSVPSEEIDEIPSDVVDLVGLTEGYGTTQISGLTRPKATINRTKLAGANASRISGAQIDERNIVLTVVPQGDTVSQMENLRQELYNILPFDTTLRFYVKTRRREVFIDGYVESLGSDADEPNGEELAMQISVICPFSWFQEVYPLTYNLTANTAQTVAYIGDVSAGFTLSVPNYSVSDLSITIGDETFAYSGVVRSPKICTIPGKKSFTGYRTGQSGGTIDMYAPAIGAISSDCKWPTLSRGNCEITVSCAADSVSNFDSHNTLTYRNTYSGV